MTGVDADGAGKAVGKTVWRITKAVLAVFFVLFVAGVIWRMPIVAEQDRSKKVSEDIRAARLQIFDVDGSKIPAAPDSAKADATVEGIDVNQNGIRDDVERAIFDKYPVQLVASSISPDIKVDTNLKLRAAELQYAKALQFYLSSVFSKETLVAAAWQNTRGFMCVDESIGGKPEKGSPDEVWKVFDNRFNAEIKSIESLVFDTSPRQEAKEKAFENMTSHGSPNGGYCDLAS